MDQLVCFSGETATPADARECTPRASCWRMCASIKYFVVVVGFHDKYVVIMVTIQVLWYYGSSSDPLCQASSKELGGEC